MPKWFPWVVGLIGILVVIGFFVSRDVQRKLDEARETARDVKEATKTVDKYGGTINAIGSAWNSVSSLWK